MALSGASAAVEGTADPRIKDSIAAVDGLSIPSEVVRQAKDAPDKDGKRGEVEEVEDKEEKKEKEEKEEEQTLVVDWYGSTYMFPSDDIDRYFDVDGQAVRVNLKKEHGCTLGTGFKCNCERWDSYLCNHMFNHVKSGLGFGRFVASLRITGVFRLES